MNSIAIFNSLLPTKIEELCDFIVINREKLNAARAAIRAIDKVGYAKDVRDEMVQQAMELNEAIIDAETQLGMLTMQMPKATKGTGANQHSKRAEILGGENFSSNDRPVWFSEYFDDDAMDELDERLARKEANRTVTKAERLKEMNISKDQVSDYERMAKHQDIVEQAKAEARENNELISRQKIIGKIKEAEKEESRKVREEKIAEQVAQPKTSNHVDIFTTENKYRVIYADPPWSYGDKQNIDGLGGAEKHYPTMPLEDICNLPVPAEDDAVLFLWVTSPMLEDCFKVINAWGFKYKSSFVWDKVKHNMGHYNSVRHELLLICTRGNCMPDVNKLYDSVVTAERTEHSKKPEIFREMIDTLYPLGQRLEMFAREASDGWDVWGNMA